jgi:hypothetical protein
MEAGKQQQQQQQQQQRSGMHIKTLPAIPGMYDLSVDVSYLLLM